MFKNFRCWNNLPKLRIFPNNSLSKILVAGTIFLKSRFFFTSQFLKSRSICIAAPCDFSDEDMSVIDGELSSASSGGGKKGPGLMGSSGGIGGAASVASKKANDRKSARARTVLSEKQLNILKTCYSANPRPDALMKEQLVEMTNLSPRVIRVWFQNKRCKDKKVQNRLMEKQMQRETVRKYFVTFKNCAGKN